MAMLPIIPNRQFVLPLAREWIEIQLGKDDHITLDVLPLAREWIEMLYICGSAAVIIVLPLAREWIEISCTRRV